MPAAAVSAGCDRKRQQFSLQDSSSCDQVLHKHAVAAESPSQPADSVRARPALVHAPATAQGTGQTAAAQRATCSCSRRRCTTSMQVRPLRGTAHAPPVHKCDNVVDTDDIAASGQRLIWAEHIRPCARTSWHDIRYALSAMLRSPQRSCVAFKHDIGLRQGHIMPPAVQGPVTCTFAHPHA